MPKYWLVKVWLITLPPSGKGATESLELAQAPLTRITPSGTFVVACTLSEKSPPFLEGWGFAAWLQATEEDAIISTMKKVRKRMFVLPIPSDWCRSIDPFAFYAE